jgi:Peptidase family M28
MAELPRQVAPARAGATVAVLLVLTALAVLALVAVLATAAPPARPADAAAGDFSAARAGEHVARIAQRPHPVGTDEQGQVRQYLVDTARAMGATVEVESSGAIRVAEESPFPSATVRNVVARVPGTAPQTSGGSALVLVAHYDSVPTGPGAADNGAAVAAMLETMRALRASGGVRNDVVFLFTDAEEPGLLGATAFVERHGVGGLGAVLNWEARGSRGPVWTFEASDGNGPLVRAFAAGSSRPVANSLTYEVYRRLPHDTDFTVFREAGAAGLNAAFLEGFHDYHAASDTPQRLSADSLQHHGETMLGLVRVLGDTDLRSVRGENAVYFDVFARKLVHYPAAVVVPVALISVLVLGLLVSFGARRSTLRPVGVLAVAGVALGAVAGAAALAFGVWRLVLLLRPDLAALPLSEPYEQASFAAGFAMLALMALLFLAWLLRRRNHGELVAGVLLVLALPLVVSAFVAPGVTFLVQWPLLAGLPSLWFAAARGRRSVLLDALAPAVALILFAPLVDNLLVALGIPLAAVAVAFAVLGGAVLVPLLVRLPRVGLLAVGAALAVAGMLGVSVADSGFAPREPRPNALIYVRDTAGGKTMWITGDPRPDAWTALALGANATSPTPADAITYLPQFADRSLLAAPAPAVELPAPTVELLADTTVADTRTVRFRVASARQAWKLQVRLPVAPLQGCTVAGSRIDDAVLLEQADELGGVVFHHFGGPPLELACELDAGASLPVDVCDYSNGLPPAVGALVGPRPGGHVPVSYGVGPVDSAVVRHAVTL